MQPFISFYTPTYRRPQQLAACLESVRQQTLVNEIEQIVIPDHVGLGIGGMFQKVKDYAPAVHGEYVHFLADDDVLASPTVVEELKRFVRSHGNPPIVVVSVVKAGSQWPAGDPWPPRMGSIDLGCIITRSDVWKEHAKDYGDRYEGDFDHMQAMHLAGHPVATWCSLVFSRGAVSHGRPEVAA